MIKDQEFLEKLLIKSILCNRKFFSMVFDKIEERYFDETVAAHTFKIVSDYFKEYKNLPERDILYSLFDKGLLPNIKEYINEAESIDFDNTKS